MFLITETHRSGGGQPNYDLYSVFESYAVAKRRYDQLTKFRPPSLICAHIGVILDATDAHLADLSEADRARLRHTLGPWNLVFSGEAMVNGEVVAA